MSNVDNVIYINDKTIWRNMRELRVVIKDLRVQCYSSDRYQKALDKWSKLYKDYIDEYVHNKGGHHECETATQVAA